jgi:hypothetical protein
MLAAAAAHQLLLAAVRVAWVVGVLVRLQLLELPGAQIRVVVVGQVMALTAALAVQALSFFATPAQFNISLVAQYY